MRAKTEKRFSLKKKNKFLARYAGEYEFNNGNAENIFNDLKQKLIQLYGEPHTVGQNLDSALGEAKIPEDRVQEYAQQIERYSPSYAVWISTANNAALVLKTCNEGAFSRTKLDYISLDAAEIFEQLENSADNSFEGL